MAKKVEVQLIDDLDGSPGVTTIGFAFAGKSYEIDLSDANADHLHDVLAPYIEAGRKAGSGGGKTKGTPATATDRERNQEIRAWAQEQGLTISNRGRISAEVQEKYEAAH